MLAGELGGGGIRLWQAIGAGIALSGFGWWVWRSPQPIPEPVSHWREEDVSKARLALGVLLQASQDTEELPPEVDPFGQDVAIAAEEMMYDLTPGFRDDCSGFVSAVMTQAGAPMDGTVATIWALALKNGAVHYRETPEVGDLVFFDNTHDRNGNGDLDDELTHIGVVVAVAPDGTATFAHGGTSRGRVYGQINVVRYWETQDTKGRRLNSYIRDPEPWDPIETSYLAGELWVAFAKVNPDQDWYGR